MAYNGTALLPAGVHVNPATREGEYMEAGQTLYVLQRLGSSGLTVASSFGDAGWALGSVQECYHDQEGYQFGTGQRVVGIHHVNGAIEGNVPSRKLPLRVFK